jgi:hypothetical protein
MQLKQGIVCGHGTGDGRIMTSQIPPIWVMCPSSLSMRVCTVADFGILVWILR